MNIDSKLMILHQIDPPSTRPFRIIEVFTSCEGPRTRVAGGTWKSLEDAIKARDRFLAHVEETPAGKKGETYDPDEE